MAVRATAADVRRERWMGNDSHSTTPPFTNVPVRAHQRLRTGYRNHPTLSATSSDFDESSACIPARCDLLPRSYTNRRDGCVLAATAVDPTSGEQGVSKPVDFHELYHQEYGKGYTDGVEQEYKQLQSQNRASAADPFSRSSNMLKEVAHPSFNQFTSNALSIHIQPISDAQPSIKTSHQGPRITVSRSQTSTTTNPTNAASPPVDNSSRGSLLSLHPTSDGTHSTSSTFDDNHHQILSFQRGLSPQRLSTSYTSAPLSQPLPKATADDHQFFWFNNQTLYHNSVPALSFSLGSEDCRSQDSWHSQNSTTMALDTDPRESPLGGPLSTSDSYKNHALLCCPSKLGSSINCFMDSMTFPSSFSSSVSTNDLAALQQSSSVSTNNLAVLQQSVTSSPPSLEVLPGMDVDSKSPTPMSLRSPSNQTGSPDWVPYWEATEIEDATLDPPLFPGGSLGILANPAELGRDGSWVSHNSLPPADDNYGLSAEMRACVPTNNSYRNDGAPEKSSKQDGVKKKHHKGHNREHGCAHCSLKFHLKKDRDRHQDIHIGKKYTCGVCGKRLARRDGLLRHVKNLHPQASQGEMVGSRHLMLSGGRTR